MVHPFLRSFQSNAHVLLVMDYGSILSLKDHQGCHDPVHGGTDHVVVQTTWTCGQGPKLSFHVKVISKITGWPLHQTPTNNDLSSPQQWVTSKDVHDPKTMLRHAQMHKPVTTWDEPLTRVMIYYNTSFQETTRETFFLLCTASNLEPWDWKEQIWECLCLKKIMCGQSIHITNILYLHTYYITTLVAF